MKKAPLPGRITWPVLEPFSPEPDFTGQLVEDRFLVMELGVVRRMVGRRAVPLVVARYELDRRRVAVTSETVQGVLDEAGERLRGERAPWQRPGALVDVVLVVDGAVPRSTRGRGPTLGAALAGAVEERDRALWKRDQATAEEMD